MGSVSIKSVLSPAFAFGLAASALTASAAQTAKAVWDSKANTFTFYYDENTYEGDGITQYALPTENKYNTSPAWNVADGPKASVTKAVFDESFADYKPANMNSWFSCFSKLTSIEGMEYLDTSNAGYCSWMFSGCSSLTSIDLSHFNTTKMQFREFFKNCSSIEELDLTSFTTVVDTRSMFYGMSKLKTIYVTEQLSINSTSTDSNVFSGCTVLAGGAGTEYSVKKIKTLEYARIDNPPDAPGYFTLGQKPVPPEIDSVTASEVTWESATVRVDGSALNGGTIVVELITGGETAKSAELTEFGAVAFTGLTPATEYAVKVTATSKYGTTVDEATSFTTQPLPVPTISGVKVDTVLHDTVMLTVSGESIADVEVKVDLIEGGEIRATKTEDAFGEFVFEGLTPETTYAVKVTATNQYGPSVDESTSFTTLEKPADEWKVVWDETGKAGTLSWGKWKFNVTLAKDGTLAVGLVTAWPDSVYPLDFSLPIKDGEGESYVISTLNPQFCYMKSGAATEWDPSPCPAVGLLTLPGEGLVTIGAAAFAKCVNADSCLVFPVTLTSIGSAAFDGSVNLSIDGASIPEALTEITAYCFRGVKNLFGDVVLPNVKSVGQAAFNGTGITSVSFGSGLTVISGNDRRGAFQGCTSLTNVLFDATAKVQMTSAQTFNGCTELEVLDLSPVVNMVLVSDRNDYSHVSGCSKLKKIIFGAGLTNLTYNAMASASALEEVVFEGVPPVGFKLPYLSQTKNSGAHDTGYDSKSITTYVHRKLVNEKNEAGMCWADYAANGRIGAAKTDPAKNTTWAAEYVYEGVDLAKRQLLTIEPGTGLMLLVR